jgi:beta-alanine--pyruvate transaminase
LQFRLGESHLIACYNEGLLIRVTADIIALSPPLVIEKEQIDRLVEILAKVIKEQT